MQTYWNKLSFWGLSLKIFVLDLAEVSLCCFHETIKELNAVILIVNDKEFTVFSICKSRQLVANERSNCSVCCTNLILYSFGLSS